MYITGGVGSMGDGEAFTFPYDLPNDIMYSETCAAIGLMMWMWLTTIVVLVGAELDSEIDKMLEPPL
jgi:DUF1680 family protein